MMYEWCNWSPNYAGIVDHVPDGIWFKYQKNYKILKILYTGGLMPGIKRTQLCGDQETEDELTSTFRP